MSKSDIEKRREFQAMSHARQWLEVGVWTLVGCAFWGATLGVALWLFGVSLRTCAGAVWALTAVNTFGLLYDRTKDVP